MRRIACGTSGSSVQPVCVSWQELHLGYPWQEVVEILAPGRVPRPLQALALGTHRLLESRRHCILSAPTNSGKSLLGLLVLLDAVSQGRRAVLLEPLRALAHEKMAELESVTPRLTHLLGRPLTVRISTGDYRRDD